MTYLIVERYQYTLPMKMQKSAWQVQNAQPHYAAIYIDQEGTLRHEWSLSISNHYESVFLPRVTSEFLKAVAESNGSGPPNVGRKLNTLRTRTGVAFG
jgi:hypothetical protein